MYEVEAIVGKRINPETSTLEYKVKWYNYAPEDNTWEPEKNLKFVRNLIEDYNKRNEIKSELGQGQSQSGDGKQALKDEIVVKEGGDQKIESNQKNEDQDEESEKEEGAIFYQEEESEQPKKSDDSSYNQQTEKQQKRGKSKPKTPVQPVIQPEPKVIKPQKEQERQKEPQKMIPIPKQATPFPKHPRPQMRQSLSPNQMAQPRQKAPPLPPDYEVNKARYIEPNSVRERPPMQPIPKHKMIEKNRPRPSGNRTVNQPQFRPQLPQQKPYMEHAKKESNPRNLIVQRPASKIVPPPPPPPAYIAQHSNQPIYQQNYFSNQYQVYGHRVPQQGYGVPPAKPYAKPVIPPRPPVARPVRPPPPPPRRVQRVYEPPVEPVYQEVYQPSYNYEGYEVEVERAPSPKPKSLPPLDIYEVTSMEKTEDGYVYLAETSQGPLWLTREQLVPKYSTIVLEFYQKHITFD